MPIQQIGSGPGQGYYQIEAGQGVSAQCANDATCATAAFYTRWNVKGCTSQQGQLWQTNPTQAAANAAHCAERNGTAYSPAQQAAGAQLAGLALTKSGNTSGIIGAIQNAISGIDNQLCKIPGIGNGNCGNLDNPSLTPAGQVVKGGIQALLSPDALSRIVLIVGGVIVAGVSVSKLVGIGAVPIPV
jgi:hypothetical protein